MSRGLSAAAKAYTGPRWWTAEVTTPLGTLFRFYSGPADSMLILGNAYQARLQLTEGFRRTRSMVTEGGSIALVNVDGYFDALFIAEPNWEGGLCVVQQFLVGVETLVEIFRGKLAEQRLTRGLVSFALRPEMDVAQVRVPRLELNALCEWLFGKGTGGGPCGYDQTAVSVTVNIAERTSTAATAQSITDSALAETVDAHVDRLVVMTTGAQKGKVRRIKTNTATAFTFYQPLPASPAIGDKFIVFTAAAGVPKWLKTSASMVEKFTCTTFTARTAGSSTLAMTTDEHKSEGTEADSGVVRTIGGTGSGQQRRIKGNTATVFTIADDEPDFSPAPDGTTVAQVLYRYCPKDVFDACENRGRTHSFNGFPVLTPDLQRLYNEDQGIPSGGAGGRGGGTGGGHGGGARDRLVVLH